MVCSPADIQESLEYKMDVIALSKKGSDIRSG